MTPRLLLFHVLCFCLLLPILPANEPLFDPAEEGPTSRVLHPPADLKVPVMPILDKPAFLIDNAEKDAIATRQPASQRALDLLAQDLDMLFDGPAFQNAFWGVMVQSMDTGQVLYARNAKRQFMPASNLKLITTAVGLELLGPRFQYETVLYSTDPDLSDGAINGDLIVHGVGDPSFAPRFHGGNTLAPFEAWAETLAEKGIRRVTGRLIADGRRFGNQAVGDGWYYHYLSSWYAAETGAFCLNDNCHDIRVLPGEEAGQPPAIETSPPRGYGRFIVRAETTGPRGLRGIDIHRTADSNDVYIDGHIPIEAPPYALSVTVHDPAAFFIHHLAKVLTESGLILEGEALPSDRISGFSGRPADWRPLARYLSPPLSEIVKETNKHSQNLYAEQIFKTLGDRKGRHGSFDEGGKVVRAFLRKMGLTEKGLLMEDGSGLSRTNLLQPRHIVELLTLMRDRPSFPYFYDSLPVAGHDGSLKTRMGGTRALGRVRAKTGFIKRVVALSGYLETHTGENIAFAMILNHFTAHPQTAIRAIDRACDRIARFRVAEK